MLRTCLKEYTPFLIFKRGLNSSQTAAALRPFYFSVHPDLFGRFPRERSVNEESLKTLHEYVSSIQAKRSLILQPINLVFYLRQINTFNNTTVPDDIVDDDDALDMLTDDFDKEKSDENKQENKEGDGAGDTKEGTKEKSEELKSVRISLQSHDLRKTVSTILSACNLPLDYINSITEQSTTYNSPIFYPQWSENYRSTKPKQPIKRTLKKWLQENHERIQNFVESSRHTHGEVDRLSAQILSETGVASVRWENVWGLQHYITCLRTFLGLSATQGNRMRKTLEGHRLTSQLGLQHYITCLRTFLGLSATQGSRMRKTLEGRNLVFGNITGVNIHGDIVMASEDVPEEWIRLLDTVRAYDPVIERIPWMENELSRLLNNINVIRTPQQKFMMAQDYEVLLNKMLNTVRRCHGLVQQELGDQDLSHLIMVTEGGSSPLALTNCGHIMIPSSIPGSILVNFIVENKERAATFLIDAKMHTFYMDQILAECHERLSVASLSHDDAITPQQMTECCQRLLDNSLHTFYMDQILAECYERLSMASLSRDDAITPQQMTECCQRLLDNSLLVNQWLKGIRLKISTYYTVMSDGEVTIPWDWVGDET